MAKRTRLHVQAVDAPAPLASASAAYGKLAITSQSTPIVIDTPGVWYPVNLGWADSGVTSGITVNETLGILTLGNNGAYATMCTIVFTSTIAPCLVQWGVQVNSLVVNDLLGIVPVITNIYPQTVAITGIDEMSSGDTISIAVLTGTSPGTIITPISAHLAVYKIG
jgi:hypothetical protein